MGVRLAAAAVVDRLRELHRVSALLEHWNATLSNDDQVWLEMQLACSIPEYAEWLAARGK
ncbi:MAG: hypothetical protein V4566_08325 [Pseudomonadota bacterium]|jgi:hypothetical protein